MGFFKSVLIDAVLFIALAGLFAQTGMSKEFPALAWHCWPAWF